MKTRPYQRILHKESCDGPQGRINYPDGFVSHDKQWRHFAFDDNRSAPSTTSPSCRRPLGRYLSNASSPRHSGSTTQPQGRHSLPATPLVGYSIRRRWHPRGCPKNDHLAIRSIHDFCQPFGSDTITTSEASLRHIPEI
jgi:hypothetical protein